MQYLSTRGNDGPLDFEQVMRAGLARDGGLYVPAAWPTINAAELRSLRGRPYADLAHAVIRRFVEPCMDEDDLKAILHDAYARFDHAVVTPLVQVGPQMWVMELFHGPTLAFKDVALQVLGRLYDHVLERSGDHVTLIGATSGDTGSAAIEAVRGRRHASIFILHPHNRTSEVQRRQMTTVHEPNVHNIAIQGTFDDCQAMVKAMFGDADFRDEVRMSAVNSINWGRIAPQVVYYFHAALALGAPHVPVRFAVPTGNFGDIYAGYVAKRMGLPIDLLIIGSNVNDILTRVLATGDHSLGEVHPTMSPSMDIQVSSNFERLLFDVYDRDGGAVVKLMDQLKEQRRFEVPRDRLVRIGGEFAAARVDEPQTLALVREMFQRCRYMIDPHTAVGLGAARAVNAQRGDAPTVALATAHPAKFPDAVEKATGRRPALPEHLADLYERTERFDVLPNDLSAVQGHIRGALASAR